MNDFTFFQLITAVLALLSVLLLVAWQREREKPKSGQSHSASESYFDLRTEFEAKLNTASEEAQRRRLVMLDLASRVHQRDNEVRLLHKALQRRNRALKSARAARDNLIIERDEWTKYAHTAYKQIVTLCDILPPTEEVYALRQRASAAISWIEKVEASLLTRTDIDGTSTEAPPQKAPGQVLYEEYLRTGTDDVYEWYKLDEPTRANWARLEQDKKELDALDLAQAQHEAQ